MAIFNETMVGGVNTKDCTADASKILDGYTAAVGKEIVEGTMPDNGNVDSAIADGVLKEGYTNGGAIVNLIAENIKNGVTICGVTGTLSSIEGVTITKESKSVEITFNKVYGQTATGSNYYGRKANAFVSSMITSDGITYTSSGFGSKTAYRHIKFVVFKYITVHQGVLNDGTIISSSSPVTIYLKGSGTASGSTSVINGMSSSDFVGTLDITWGSIYIKYYGGKTSDTPVGLGTLYYDEYTILQQ